MKKYKEPNTYSVKPTFDNFLEKNMGLGVLFGVIFIGALVIFIFSASSLFDNKKTPDYGAIVDAVTQKSMQRRNLFIEEFVPLMKSEFPQFADEFSVVTLDKFCEFSGDWICAHHPEEYAVGARQKSIENSDFKKDLQARLTDFFPEKFANHAQGDFQSWLNRIDNIVKVAVKRSWPRLEKVKAE